MESKGLVLVLMPVIAFDRLKLRFGLLITKPLNPIYLASM